MAKTPKETSESKSKKWLEILKRTRKEEVFKQRLLRTPNEVFKEYGIDVPKGVTLKVQENTPTTHYLILPGPEDVQEASQIRKASI